MMLCWPSVRERNELTNDSRLVAQSPMPTKTALITGATGAIGPSVVRALDEAGYRIRTLSRSRPQSLPFPSNVELFTGDITNPATIERAFDGVNLVVHLAALLHVVRPSRELSASYERVNIEGT